MIDTCSAATVRPAYDSETGRGIICTGKAVVTSGSGVIPGDSGAPVISPISGDGVELLGTLFSGHSNWLHFTKLGLIYYELDSPATWDSCVSGC